jgi:dTDP-4-dehydrorhamnose 3,5-epimerase
MPLPTRIPGCYQIPFPKHADERGSFVKAHHHSTFVGHGLLADFAETFYTVSEANVLRGMHLLLPPADHAKLVYCVAGSVIDVALDLRRGSPAFGKFEAMELSADHPSGVYLPCGVAHGFYVRHAPAVMVYHVTSEHAPHLDAGVRWDSFGAQWPDDAPLISVRDARLPPLRDFESPFEYLQEEFAVPGRFQ